MGENIIISPGPGPIDCILYGLQTSLLRSVYLPVRLLAWASSMAPIESEVFLPPLDKCFSGEHQLL